MDAQKAEYWSEEEGFQAMRRSLISHLRPRRRRLQPDGSFQKFDGDVDTAVSVLKLPSRAMMSLPVSLRRWTRSLQGHRHPLRRRRPRRSRAGEQRRLETLTAPRRRVQVAAALVPVRVHAERAV